MVLVMINTELKLMRWLVVLLFTILVILAIIYIQPPFNSWQHPLGNTEYTIVSGGDYGDWRGNRRHKGIDLATYNETTPPVKAAKGGTVTVSLDKTGYGNYITIDHGNGLETLYAHLSSVNVSSGQTVNAGTHIGNVGETGNANGIHLHFEIRVNGSPKNPRKYIDF